MTGGKSLTLQRQKKTQQKKGKSEHLRSSVGKYISYSPIEQQKAQM